MDNLYEITQWLNNYFNVNNIVDEYSLNGLQVGKNKKLNKIAFAVDAYQNSFLKAKEANADLLITHHGIINYKAKAITNSYYSNIEFLIKNEIALYSIHLPLDVDPEIGNNAEFIKILNVKKNTIKALDIHCNFPLGYIAELDKEYNTDDFVNLIGNKLKTKPNLFSFNNKKVKTIAFCSGSSGKLLDKTINQNIDLFITGEISHSTYINASDNNINILTVGHYASETLGLKALSKLINEKFGITTEFLDIPTNT